MCTHIYLMMMIQIATVSSKNYYCSHKRVKIFNEVLGTITTRLPWESYYTNNIRCAWTIDAGIAHRIRITFIKIYLEQLTPGTSCEDGDFLSLRDGETKLAPVLVKICPGSTNPYEIISRGRHLHLVFKSNRNNFLDYVGIELKFEAFDRTGCPPEWISGHGYIPEYNGGYQYAGTCYRVMTKPAGGADFLTAQKFCVYSQSNLAIVNSSIMFDFLQDLTTTHGLLFNLWVGLTDKKEEGTFQWLDGSYFNSTYRMSSVSLNEKNRNCIVMNFDPKKFKVVRCDEYHFFICELNLGHSNIYTVQAEVAEGEHNGEDHYVMEDRDFVWIIIGAVAAVALIVLCIVLQVNRSKTINIYYSSGQVECERSIRIHVQDQSLHQRERDVEASEACLVQPSAQQPPVEPLPNLGPVSEPSAPPLSELQTVIGPPSSDQGAPPSYWEAVYT